MSLLRPLFAARHKITFVGSRRQKYVVTRGQGHVELGIQPTGDHCHVTIGTDRQIPPGRHFSAVLRNRLIEVTAAPCIGAAILHRGDVHIAISIERHVPTALQHATDIVDVLTGLDGQIIGRLDPSSVIEIVAVTCITEPAVIDTGHITLVDHATVGGRQADILARDNAAGLVDNVVAGLEREAFAGFDQAGVGEVVTGFGRQVVGGSQRAGVIEVAAGDQSDIAALNQRPVWR